MTSLAWKQKITIHTLPGISKGKDNQIMKFGQSIKYRVNFSQKPYRKQAGQTSYRPYFLKKQKQKKA